MKKQTTPGIRTQNLLVAAHEMMEVIAQAVTEAVQGRTILYRKRKWEIVHAVVDYDGLGLVCVRRNTDGTLGKKRRTFNMEESGFAIEDGYCDMDPAMVPEQHQLITKILGHSPETQALIEYAQRVYYSEATREDWKA